MGELEPVLTAIDRTNADDPNPFAGEPLALVQGRIAHRWVLSLDPDASPALQIAARAHHLRRWVVPRDSYPAGRAGYLRWRRDQKARHGRELEKILAGAVAPPVLNRAVEIVQKIGLGHDAEVQVFEDAVSLTFIQTQFVTTADKLADDDKMVDVVAKTLRKMSPAGIAAAGSIELDERSAGIVARAVQQLPD